MLRLSFLLLFCLMLLLAGCSDSKVIRTSEVKTFEKSMLSRYKTIQEISVKVTKRGIEFRYKWDGPEEERTPIFEETRAFFQSKCFQEKVVQVFQREHDKRTFSYPDVEISFSNKSLSITDSKYIASYYGSNTDPDVVDDYRTWYFVDGDKPGAIVNDHIQKQ